MEPLPAMAEALAKVEMKAPVVPVVATLRYLASPEPRVGLRFDRPAVPLQVIRVETAPALCGTKARAAAPARVPTAAMRMMRERIKCFLLGSR